MRHSNGWVWCHFVCLFYAKLGSRASFLVSRFMEFLTRRVSVGHIQFNETDNYVQGLETESLVRVMYFVDEVLDCVQPARGPGSPGLHDHRKTRRDTPPWPATVTRHRGPEVGLWPVHFVPAHLRSLQWNSQTWITLTVLILWIWHTM